MQDTHAIQTVRTLQEIAQQLQQIQHSLRQIATAQIQQNRK
jgi:hypothetical protein